MIAILVALGVTALVTPVVVVAAERWHLIDVPNHRSSHAAPIPRGGGLAVIAGTAAGVAAWQEWDRRLIVAACAALVLGAIGLLDDHHGLPAMPRLGVQIVTPVVGGLVVLWGDGAGLVLGCAVAVIAVAGYVNAFNFMDGINGISGSQAAIAGVALAAIADHLGDDVLVGAGLSIAGASLGFLPFNAWRARVFLGDVGSYAMGCWLAAVAVLLVDAGAAATAVIAPFLLYVLDTSTVLFDRARRGAPLMEAHREHAYQRLVQLGWTHQTVTLLCAGVTASCAALGWLTVDSSLGARAGATAVSVALVAAYVVLPRRLAARSIATRRA